MVRNNLLLTAGEGLLSFKGAFSGFGDGLGMVSTSDRSAEEERSAASQNQPWFGGEESSAAFVSIRLLFEPESCRTRSCVSFASAHQSQPGSFPSCLRSCPRWSSMVDRGLTCHFQLNCELSIASQTVNRIFQVSELLVIFKWPGQTVF